MDQSIDLEYASSARVHARGLSCNLCKTFGALLFESLQQKIVLVRGSIRYCVAEDRRSWITADEDSTSVGYIPRQQFASAHFVIDA